MANRIVMLVDLDYYYAQVEETRNPSIRDKPVVVCMFSGRTEDSGAVTTANYIARRYGVRSGMPIFQARRKLEGAESVFLPVDHAFYEEVSSKVMSILQGFGDSFEQVGIDEAFLDVTRKVSESYDEARKLAGEIKEALRNQLKLTCSIGVGPNKLVAKIAADNQKPDGLTVVEREQVKTFLSPLPVNRLIGVGTKTMEKMRPLGIGTISELASCEVQKLIDVFGKTLGTYFHHASEGLDDDPVQERGEAESFSRISTLKQNTRDLDTILERTHQLCEDVHETVVQQKVLFKTVGVSAVLSDMSIRTRSRTLETATAEVGAMKEVARELLKNLLDETELDLRRVGVRVASFVKRDESQKQLTNFI